MDRRMFVKGMGSATILNLSLSRCSSAERSNDMPIEIPFKAARLPDNPIIKQDMDERLSAEAQRYGYVNINGPSLIRVPSWVSNPLGKYYLYFAHHKGEYIRLAYADEPSGPWRTYEPGCLELKDSLFPTETAGSGSALDALISVWKVYPPRVAWAMTQVGLNTRKAVHEREAQGIKGSEETRPHIASPDVIVDDEKRELRMYYHGMLADSNQMSRVAVSVDGINFRARPELLTSPYLRMFRYRGMYYGMSMPGLFNRSQDGLGNFEIRPRLVFGADMRHCALMLRGSILYVLWSRVGDAPERILCSAIDLSPEDWMDWKACGEVEILRPELGWEGADLDVGRSSRGEITEPVNQLRDPAIFEENGRTYLLYACAGENAIAIAELEV